MTISLEKIFFVYILNNKKYFSIVHPFFFKNNEVQFIYTVIRKYITNAPDAEVPKPKQIFEMVSLEDKEEIITKEILKIILKTDLSEYDEVNFIIPKFNAWILSNRLKVGTVSIIDEARNLDNTSDLDSAILTANKIRGIVEEMSNTNFVNEDDTLGSDFDDPESHVQDTARFKVRTGFDTIDHMLGGGWDIQTLNVVMAETNNGKCHSDMTKLQIKNTITGKETTIEVGKLFTKISQGDYNI